jgi:subtilase family serine protease
MNRNRVVSCGVLFLAAVVLIFSSWTSAQTGGALSRITQALDDSRLVRLHGNTHPMARPQFDQGAASPDLPMERMMLALKRSPEQEAALERLMAEQLDKSSPNYHRWLTPEQFGQQFGPSDSDIQTISSWLSSHGFQINSVAKGRNVIEFSGNASQVREALHTEIHHYVVRGEDHWANASDPQIPAALAPVVAGVNTLHNFQRKSMARSLGQYSRSKATGEVRPLHPEFNFDIGSPCGLNNTCFAVGPADFAAIYHVQQLWSALPTAIDGTGQKIAIVNDSNINIADAQNFRSLFGLPVNNPHIVLAGNDPGKNGDEIEADIDTQWTGAVAKNATIDLVIAADTNASLGLDLAAQFAVQNNVAPVLSESFGNCESALGTATNQFFNNLWMQAATQGITVLVSTGDSGAADCENPNPNLTTPQPATTGAAVSGIASTPFNTAIGGTDFNQFNTQANFWNPTPTTSATGQTQLTAKGYIPENVWNDSCTNATFIAAGFDSTILNACNDKTVTPSFIVPIGTGGGISTLYSKPTWQTALTPGDGQRDVPDVSLFAGAGLVGSFYVICQQDQDTNNAACDLNSPFQNFSAVGGTSVSTQAFAGVVAMILQMKGGPQGLINPRLYTLAASQVPANCNSSSPGASCIFNDITVGTNSVPCKLTPTAVAGCGQTITSQVTRPPSTNGFRTSAGMIALACFLSVGLLVVGLRIQERNWSVVFALMAFALLLTCAACGSGGSGPSTGGNSTNGVLPGFNAGAGYDRATGLGSVNAFNLVNNW